MAITKEEQLKEVSKKVYLPRDDNLNVFPIVSVSDGIVIPLIDFGHPGLHITILGKEVDDERFLDIHITDETKNKKKKIYHRTFPIKEGYFTDFESKLTQKIKKIWIRYQPIFLKAQVPPEGLVCTECLLGDKAPNQFSDRDRAVQAYSRLKTLELPMLPNHCRNPEHRIFYKPDTGQEIHRIINYFVPSTVTNKYSNEIVGVFKSFFRQALKQGSLVILEIKKILKTYKNL